MSAASALVEGQTLVVPAGVNRSGHNISTFRPYDASDAVGDASPTNPKMPKKNKCGMMGQVMLVAVAVGVSALLPQASIFFKTIGGKILGGMLASAASQGFGVATGIQEKFNWKSVAMAGVTAGVTAGLDQAGGFAAMGIKGSGFGTQALQGAISDATAQGIGVATGLQRKFDWAGVAAAGLGSGVSSRIGGSGTGARVVRMSADAVTGAAARSLLTGTSFGDNLVAVLPSVIGRTIGAVVEAALDGGMKDRSKKIGETKLAPRIQLASADQAGNVRSDATQNLGSIAATGTEKVIAQTDYPGASEFLDYLLQGTKNLPIAEGAVVIRANISAWIRKVGADEASLQLRLSTNTLGEFAQGEYNEQAVILAENNAIRSIYAAIGIVAPDFQWVGIGAPVASQVREAIKMAPNQQARILIGGQKIVATDVATFALTYLAYGAQAISEAGALPLEITTAFGFQAQADAAGKRGDRATAASMGARAAIEIGLYEQARLQRMWDSIDGMVSTVAWYLGFMDPTIQSPVGPIEFGGRDGMTIWDLPYRQDLARNAFEQMHVRVYSPAADPANRAAMSRYYHDLYAEVHPNHGRR